MSCLFMYFLHSCIVFQSSLHRQCFSHCIQNVGVHNTEFFFIQLCACIEDFSAGGSLIQHIDVKSVLSAIHTFCCDTDSVKNSPISFFLLK